MSAIRTVRFVLAAAALATAQCAPAAPRALAIATTTSVQNSGLLDALLPAFRQETGLEVGAAILGSGMALEALEKGHVDLAISHAPAREADLLRGGARWLYRKFMFNDFIIVGPPSDPARAADAGTAEQAMRRIAASGSRFISRGDASGTHEAERALWKRAGVEPDSSMVVSAGSGMGATLRIAGEMEAYTLTDRGTFDHFKGGGKLAVLVDAGAPANTYAVIMRADGPADARRFAEWLVTGRGRDLIARYRTGSGTPGFHVWPADCPDDEPSAVPRCVDAGSER